ncbi:MAG: hypothetical protein M3153_02530 [Chloroflexota bacterium]|nr:hypothetical protein [Chloroflexota bacterium]
MIPVQSNLDILVVLSFMAEREERLRRTNLLVSESNDRRVVRRWVGRQLVRFGTRLAGEPAMRPARAR